VEFRLPTELEFRFKFKIEVAYSDVEAERGHSALPASSDDAYNDEASRYVFDTDTDTDTDSDGDGGGWVSGHTTEFMLKGTAGEIEASHGRTRLSKTRKPCPTHTTTGRSSGSLDPTCEQRWVRASWQRMGLYKFVTKLLFRISQVAEAQKYIFVLL